MATDEMQYNLAGIRDLIRDAFTAEELRRFCQDRPLFRLALGHLGATFESVIDGLLEYCQTRALFAELLLEIERYNPRQYERHQASVYTLPAPSGSTARPSAIATARGERHIQENLPRRREFIGREKEITRVLNGLASHHGLVCINGMVGIGKTALAIETAHICLQASRQEPQSKDIPTFDGFIWTTSKDRALSLSEILDAVARTLNYPGITQEPLEEKRESVRQLLHRNRCLLIMDNLDAVTDVAVSGFLLDVPEPSQVLITSRQQAVGEAWAVSLKKMEQEEAVEFIRSEGRRLGMISLERGEETVLVRLSQATGGAPLAIAWAIGQIGQKGQSLDLVLQALQDAKADIFEGMFFRSWSLLSAEAKAILTVMSIFAASASLDGIEAASDKHDDHLHSGVAQLAEMQLLDASDELEEARRRYAIHPLTRAFAESKAAKAPDSVFAAYSRLAAWLIDLANLVRQGHASAEALEAELSTIFKVIGWCHQNAHWQQVVEFRQPLHGYLRDHGDWDSALQLGTWAQEAARALGDKLTEAWCYISPFGWFYRYRGYHVEAEQSYTKCLAMFEELGVERGQFWARMGLGDVAWRSGNLEEAQAIFDKLVGEIPQHNNYAKEATNVRLHLSRIMTARGEFDQATRLAQEGYEFAERVQDQLGMAAALQRQGLILLDQDRLIESRDRFIESMAINQAIQARHGIVWNQQALAWLDEKAGNRDAALQRATEAFDLATKLGMKREMEHLGEVLERLAAKGSID